MLRVEVLQSEVERRVGGADAQLDEPLPRNPDTLVQEVAELPGTTALGLRRHHLPICRVIRIGSKGGLVDDAILNKEYVPNQNETEASPDVLKGLSLFAIAIAHFRVLRLAYSGAIRGEIDRYKDFMYPVELNNKVYDAIQSVKEELRQLSRLG